MDKLRAKEIAIEADRLRSHVAAFIDCATSDTAFVEERLQIALHQLNQRALNAGMVIVSTLFSQSAYPVDNGEGRVCVSIVCQWYSREFLEKQRLQQQILGNGGPVR